MSDHNAHGEVSAPVPALAEQTLAIDLARTEIDQLIATAHRFPRDVDVAVRKLDQMVLRNEAAAENSVYALPRAGKAITGPSIGFANALATAWGNCWDYGRWIHTDRREKVVLAEGIFVDWETNRRLVISEQRRIVDAKGRLYSDDMIIVTSKAAAAIARRNVILNAVPRALWFPTYEKALYVVRGSEETLPNRREAAVKALANFGIEPKRIFMFLGVRGLEDIGIEHIPTLRGMFQALRDGSVTAEELLDPRKMTGAVFETVDRPLADDEEGDVPDVDQVAHTFSSLATGEAIHEVLERHPLMNEGSGTPQNLAGHEATEVKEKVSDPPSADTAPAPRDAQQPRQARRKAAAKDSNDKSKLPTTEQPRTGEEYLAYAADWMAKAKDRTEVEDRYKAERSIRNNLSTVLDEDQLAELLKQKIEAEARFEEAAQLPNAE